MKHYILAKFSQQVQDKASLLPRIREIFSPVVTAEGIHGVEVLSNCVERNNRYDVMIVIDMEPGALAAYDACEPHHRWKEEFAPILEKKAIFDHM